MSDEEVVFELGEFGADFRTAVGRVLAAEGIEFEWEGEDLVVAEEDADAVDAVLDRLEGEPLDEIVPVEDSEPADDEADYESLSDLYLAADRLFRAPDDPMLVADLDEAAAAVEGTSPPFGVAEREWSRILATARAIRESLAEGATAEGVAGDARDLRDLLRGYV